MSAKEHASEPEPNHIAAISGKPLRRSNQAEHILTGSGCTTTLSIAGENDVSLLDILDHVLNSGVVLHGSLVISLAGVDLVYLGLNVVLTSVETALRNLHAAPVSS
jgi:hypothetical protein